MYLTSQCLAWWHQKCASLGSSKAGGCFTMPFSRTAFLVRAFRYTGAQLTKCERPAPQPLLQDRKMLPDITYTW